jgi:hypothetical protein
VHFREGDMLNRKKEGRRHRDRFNREDLRKKHR